MIPMGYHKALRALLALLLGFQTAGGVASTHDPLGEEAADSRLSAPSHDHAKENAATHHCPDGHVCVLPAELPAPLILAGAAPLAGRFPPLVATITEREPDSLLRPPRPSA